jgi:hypothetical protein
MLAEQKATAGLAKGTRGQKLTRVTGTAIAEAPVSSIPTLASVGISHKLSSAQVRRDPQKQFDGLSARPECG